MNNEKGHEARSGRCEAGEEFSFGSDPHPRFRVLLIDDLEALLFTFGSGLRQYGHLVYTARSGREGIELFETNQIDVVICDLGLEDMDGWQVGERICEICTEGSRAKPPFILMTGWGVDISVQKKIAVSGVDMVLEKPIEIPELIEAVQEVTRS